VNEIDYILYVLLGAALGVAFQIWVFVYCIKELRKAIDRFHELRWEVDNLDYAVRDVNDRLWSAGMYTAEEERASRRGCYTFELPLEEQIDRKESLRESDNRYCQRRLAIGRRLEEQRAAGKS
jgi:hypothetical protein